MLIQGGTQRYESTVKTKAGVVKNILLSKSLFRNKDGEIAGIIGAIEDLTDFKDKCNKVEIKGNKLDLALKSAFLGLWEWNLKTNIVYFDDNALAMLGYDRSDIVGAMCEGSWWMKQVHPDDQDSMRNKFKDYANGDIDEYHAEFRLKTKRSEYVWISSHCTILDLDMEGNIETVIGVHENITERVNLKQELVSQYEFSNRLVETAQAIILILNTDGKIIRFNSYFEKVTGYSLNELKGKDWFETFIKDNEKSQIENIFYNSIKGKATKGNVNAIITKDNREIFIEWFDTVLKDKQNNIIGLLCTGQDVSLRIQAEKELRKLEWLNEAEKTKSKLNNYTPVYGNVIVLNKNRTILDSVGEEMLNLIATDIMSLLDTSIAVYEKEWRLCLWNVCFRLVSGNGFGIKKTLRYAR